MNAIHAAVSSPKAREMVEAVLEEYDRWARVKFHDNTSTSDEVKSAIWDLREELCDHLVIPVGIQLAAWEATDN